MQSQRRLIKSIRNFKIILACFRNIMYTIKCCDMIALKREVAALPEGIAGFPWSECQEGRLWPPQEPDGKSLYKHSL